MRAARDDVEAVLLGGDAPVGQIRRVVGLRIHDQDLALVAAGGDVGLRVEALGGDGQHQVERARGVPGMDQAEKRVRAVREARAVLPVDLADQWTRAGGPVGEGLGEVGDDLVVDAAAALIESALDERAGHRRVEDAVPERAPADAGVHEPSAEQEVRTQVHVEHAESHHEVGGLHESGAVGAVRFGGGADPVGHAEPPGRRLALEHTVVLHIADSPEGSEGRDGGIAEPVFVVVLRWLHDIAERLARWGAGGERLGGRSRKGGSQCRQQQRAHPESTRSPSPRSGALVSEMRPEHLMLLLSCRQALVRCAGGGVSRSFAVCVGPPTEPMERAVLLGRPISRRVAVRRPMPGLRPEAWPRRPRKKAVARPRKKAVLLRRSGREAAASWDASTGARGWTALERGGGRSGALRGLIAARACPARASPSSVRRAGRGTDHRSRRASVR